MGFDFTRLDSVYFVDAMVAKAATVAPVLVSLIAMRGAQKLQISIDQSIHAALGGGPLWVSLNAAHAVYRIEPHERGLKPVPSARGGTRRMIRVPVEHGEYFDPGVRVEPEYYLDRARPGGVLFVKVPAAFLTAAPAQVRPASPPPAPDVRNTAPVMPIKIPARVTGVNLTATEQKIMSYALNAPAAPRGGLLLVLGWDESQLIKAVETLNAKLGDIAPGCAIAGSRANGTLSVTRREALVTAFNDGRGV